MRKTHTITKVHKIKDISKILNTQIVYKIILK